MTNINNVNEKLWQNLGNKNNVQIDKSVKNTKLGSIFAAAIRTAANNSHRDISNWDDGDGILTAEEMKNAIKNIQRDNTRLNGNHKDKNIKTKDIDRYTGATKNMENTEGEIAAFDALNDVNNHTRFYDWTGRAGESQYEERKAQIANGQRDAEKSVRVMLRDLSREQLDAIYNDATGKQLPETAVHSGNQETTTDNPPTTPKVPEFSTFPAAVQKTLTDNYADKSIEGTPVTGEDGVTTINFKDGTSVKIAKNGKTITETDEHDKITTVYEDTVANNNTFERKTIYNPSNNMFHSSTVYTPKQGETEAPETTYTRADNGVVSKETKGKTTTMSQQEFALDENTDKAKVEVKDSQQAKNKLNVDYPGIDLTSIGIITEYRTKLDGSCVIHTKDGKKHYICKDSNKQDAPWVLHEYEQS